VLDQHLRVTVLTRGAEVAGRFDLVRAAAGPGTATALHVHSRYEERFWVISGELTVWAGLQKVTLGQGDFYTVPVNVPHMIEAGPDGAQTLNISSPAAFAELMERTATPAHLAGPDTDLDLDLFMKVTEELGDVVLGPPGTQPGEVAAARAVEDIHAVPGAGIARESGRPENRGMSLLFRPDDAPADVREDYWRHVMARSIVPMDVRLDDAPGAFDEIVIGSVGAVADHIRRRRLERCSQDLLDPAFSRWRINAIGRRWGYTDAAHFSRAFRDAHGLPPGEFRAAYSTRDLQR
jgi:mannose-6-phosphate isomerase-like protein (cupin superfamily)/AraC-like DNA-binding protein